MLGQNDLEKLLQRVLSEQMLKKVREVLEKEPTQMTHYQTAGQNELVITNANSHYNASKIMVFVTQLIDRKQGGK